MWNCKACSFVVPSRLKLLQHYRLKHKNVEHIVVIFHVYIQTAPAHLERGMRLEFI